DLLQDLRLFPVALRSQRLQHLRQRLLVLVGHAHRRRVLAVGLDLGRPLRQRLFAQRQEQLLQRRRLHFFFFKRSAKVPSFSGTGFCAGASSFDASASNKPSEIRRALASAVSTTTSNRCPSLAASRA